MSFQRAVEFVLRPDIEGVFSNHKRDRGKATKYGITQRTYNAYRKKHGLKRAPVKDISLHIASDIYRELYWQPGKCISMTEDVGMVHFDACVNHGVKNASRMIQRSVGAKADGVIGPKTLSAITMWHDDVIVLNYLRHRRRFYVKICQRKPDQLVFLFGWLERLERLRDEVL